MEFETKFPDLAGLKSTFLPALESLRCLEGELLKMIVKSQEVLHIYSRILDYHRSIWKMMISSQFEGLPVVWNLLRKEIMKLQLKFPVEVGVFLVSYHPFLSFMILPSDCKITSSLHRWKV